ncbi:hypothetical protein R3W88_028315 [Solanum pinnatisectum]|uniref:protein-serine/threonine phosphatase n=1 Tax=Solanum pinnatisectum TaxID=50273 RepID=A0AAV9LIN4_9SOLN|nr:hypothetical protein R3W88_028315 [Solanum pinnatisectum]
MFRWLERIVLACCEPLSRYLPSSRGEDYPLLWYKDLEKHSCGKFSFAMVQGNQVCEDYGHVEPGRQGTFVGIYDGHGGPQASRFACDHLSRHLIRFARARGTIDEEVLNNAVAATEEAFLDYVRERFETDPLIASKGSCCLVGVIWNGTLYVASLGDSRAVLGHNHIERPDRIVALQLTNDHNASNVAVRNELNASHPDDPNIVVYDREAWRVRGIIQITRALGDAYLKHQEFALGTNFPKFHLKVPITRPVVRADPEVSSRNLQAVDRFVIFASDGLWDLLTNEKAVEIVNTYPKKGIARRLLVSALDEAARRVKIKYDGLKKVGINERRTFHDDITVVVIFIDHNMLNRELSVPGMSIRGFVDAAPRQSKFNIIQQQTGSEEELDDMP